MWRLVATRVSRKLLPKPVDHSKVAQDATEKLSATLRSLCDSGVLFTKPRDRFPGPQLADFLYTLPMVDTKPRIKRQPMPFDMDYSGLEDRVLSFLKPPAPRTRQQHDEARRDELGGYLASRTSARPRLALDQALVDEYNELVQRCTPTSKQEQPT